MSLWAPAGTQLAGAVEARFSVGFPANGRRIAGRQHGGGHCPSG